MPHTDSNSTLAPTPVNGAADAKQMLNVSLLATVAVIVVLGLIGYFSANHDATPTPMVSGDSVEQRIAKVGSLAVQIQQAARATPATGEEVFKAQCTACHGTGLNGAPKFGDAAAWGPRLAQGQDALEQAPIKGYTGKTGTMPPQSGGQFTDYEIQRAVVYMANAGGAKFAEPPAPAAPASGAEPAASAAQ
ncbi:MAG: c-type cytochrome [Burkholderiaceae bacterium]|jgi:cytochrome c5|nr:c-type cytochrome [Burkholderiaceae bacterium]